MPTLNGAVTTPAVRLRTVVLTASVPPIAPVAGADTALTTRSGVTIVSGMARTLLPSSSSTTSSTSSTTATRNIGPAGVFGGIVTAVEPGLDTPAASEGVTLRTPIGAPWADAFVEDRKKPTRNA